MQEQRLKNIPVGTKVKIVVDSWPGSPTSVVTGTAKPLSTNQGDDYIYWVRLTLPAMDIDGQGPFSAAMIPSVYLEPQNEGSDEPQQ